MADIQATSLPDDALLGRYAATDGAYTDCYRTELAFPVDLAAFVRAFYTTRLFKLERWILRWAVRRPSTDDEAARLVPEALDRFAAWSVEDRTDRQLLMCDMGSRTRSWFMVAPGEGNGTRLYFGSAVVPKGPARGEKPKLGFLFTALLGFHKLYSRALLSAARAKISDGKRGP